MTEYVGQNFALQTPGELAGKKVGVPLYPGEACRYVGCNLGNREPAAGSVIIDCNTTIRTFDEVVGQIVITIDDGEDITEDITAGFVHGKLNPETLEYEYKDTPEEVGRSDA